MLNKGSRLLDLNESHIIIEQPDLIFNKKKI